MASVDTNTTVTDVECDYPPHSLVGVTTVQLDVKVTFDSIDLFSAFLAGLVDEQGRVNGSLDGPELIDPLKEVWLQLDGIVKQIIRQETRT